MKLAVSGKGGVGKTTIAATLARLMARQERQVLALDADSNPNLAIPLGIDGGTERIAPVPADLGEWKEDDRGRAYVQLTIPLPEVIQRYGTRGPDGVLLLVMGTVNHAGVGCRCSAHAAARGITGQMVAEADVAVLDMEAGMEHLGRGTVEHVDTLLVVTEPYFRALQAASHIRHLAYELGVPRILVVANRLRSDEERDAVLDYCHRHGLEVVSTIPFDEAIPEAERLGLAPLDYSPDSPAMCALRELAARLLAQD
ncbi:MAG TPA: P-loop NTPase [Chloroflexota bacterium]|nr:P-loop NTPase [Chloroflexota bacterium]